MTRGECDMASMMTSSSEIDSRLWDPRALQHLSRQIAVLALEGLGEIFPDNLAPYQMDTALFKVFNEARQFANDAFHASTLPAQSSLNRSTNMPSFIGDCTHQNVMSNINYMNPVIGMNSMPDMTGIQALVGDMSLSNTFLNTMPELLNQGWSEDYQETGNAMGPSAHGSLQLRVPFPQHFQQPHCSGMHSPPMQRTGEQNVSSSGSTIRSWVEDVENANRDSLNQANWDMVAHLVNNLSYSMPPSSCATPVESLNSVELPHRPPPPPPPPPPAQAEKPSLPTTIGQLPLAVQTHIHTLLKEVPILKDSDFDRTVVENIMEMDSNYGTKEVLSMLDNLKQRMRAKEVGMQNLRGYLHVAVCHHLDTLQLAVASAQFEDVRALAIHHLDKLVFENLETAIASNQALNWSLLDPGIIMILKRYTTPTAIIKIKHLASRSFKNVKNMRGYIMSLLGPRGWSCGSAPGEGA